MTSIAERIRAANSRDAEAAASAAVLNGSAAPCASDNTKSSKWDKPVPSRKPSIVRRESVPDGERCAQEEVVPAAAGGVRARMIKFSGGLGGGMSEAAPRNPAATVTSSGYSPQGRSAALAKLGGASSWCTTSHASVSAHIKPFNKFAQATGARYEEAGQATSGSKADMARWNHIG